MWPGGIFAGFFSSSAACITLPGPNVQMSAANMPVPTLANSDTHTPRVYCLLEEQRTTLSARRGSLQRQLHGLPFTPVPHIVARLERLVVRGFVLLHKLVKL